MKFEIFLKKANETYKVTEFECCKGEASRQLSLYLFRHYPVSFYDDLLSDTGDSEKVLKDARSGLVVWRQGDMECTIPEGFFYVNEYKETQAQQISWWETSLPQSKKVAIEIDIDDAYTRGYMEGLKQNKQWAVISRHEIETLITCN